MVGTSPSPKGQALELNPAQGTDSGIKMWCFTLPWRNCYSVNSLEKKKSNSHCGCSPLWFSGEASVPGPLLISSLCPMPGAALSTHLTPKPNTHCQSIFTTSKKKACLLQRHSANKRNISRISHTTTNRSMCLVTKYIQAEPSHGTCPPGLEHSCFLGGGEGESSSIKRYEIQR